MERLAELISKLKEQFEHNADHQQLLVTTQMIEQELTRRAMVKNGNSGSNGAPGSKIAVVMPAARKVVTGYTPEPPSPVEVKNPEPVKNSEPVPARANALAAQTAPQPVYVPVDPEEETIRSYALDPMKEIPTLAQQTTFRDLNEVIGVSQSSLNDQLKNEVVEVGHKLTDSPIRDLKKAIGINDRFVFISELFRGDEVMYERSLKTINNFRIFAEAEYWIERELKVKLGWDDTRPAVKHFYQLVKRRFI